MAAGIARFKDFTGDSEPITFAVRGETFTALDDIPLGSFGQLVALDSDDDDGRETAEKVREVFKLLLEPESFERFSHAVNGTNINGNVIGASRIKQIIPWLMEQYGLRPTEASSGFGETSSENGASSTDGQQQTVSILEFSAPVEASTSPSIG